MKRIFSLLLLFFLTAITSFVRGNMAFQFILQKKVAITVSSVRLYTDSSYAQATNTLLTEGELFEILGETTREHFDNSQNQTFKWYKVRSLTGQIGWVFGDNLAVVLPERFVENALKPFYKKEAHFDNGFEKAMIWVAAVEGHDDKHRSTAFFNPAYKEFYIVITNEIGKSTLLNYANVNESGKKDLYSIHFQDVTENNINDIIIETGSVATGKNLEERVLDIYSFKGGTLSKIFEERLTLTWEDDIPSPAFSKFVEIDGSTIRIACVDFVNCNIYKHNVPTDTRSETQERCLEYATSSFVWDNTERTFKPLYKESRLPIYAFSTHNIFLKKTPSVSATVLNIAKPTDKLHIIKHFEDMVTVQGKKKTVYWMYVKHPSGSYGYIEAQDIQFKNIEHAPILKEFYQQKPLLKSDWKPEIPFIKFLSAINSALEDDSVAKKQ